MIFFRKQVISLPWRNTFYYEYEIFFILLIVNMKNWNAPVTHFFYLFTRQQIVDWDLLKTSTNSQVHLNRFHPTNSQKASWLKSDERSGLGSSLNDVFTRTKIWKTVSDLSLSNDTLTINTTTFLSYFMVFCYS